MTGTAFFNGCVFHVCLLSTEAVCRGNPQKRGLCWVGYDYYILPVVVFAVDQDLLSQVGETGFAYFRPMT